MEWDISLGKKHGQDPLTPLAFWLYVGLCAFLVGMAGLMSGLTLGLMSLDEVDMEVRSLSRIRAAMRLEEQCYMISMLLGQPTCMNGNNCMPHPSRSKTCTT
jgi:hypothetical protein